VFPSTSSSSHRHQGRLVLPSRLLLTCYVPCPVRVVWAWPGVGGREPKAAAACFQPWVFQTQRCSVQLLTARETRRLRLWQLRTSSSHTEICHGVGMDYRSRAAFSILLFTRGIPPLHGSLRHDTAMGCVGCVAGKGNWFRCKPKSNAPPIAVWLCPGPTYPGTAKASELSGNVPTGGDSK